MTADPARRFDPFPLTDQQQAYLIGRTGSFELGNVSTHAYYEYEGDLDLDRFTLAWRRAIDRHDMLRAVMDPARNEQQVLAEVPPFEPQVVDLRGQDETVVQQRLVEIRERLSHEVRPADRWPLFGVVVSRLGNRRARVHVSFDALTLDYLSWQLLVADITRFYDDPGVALAPLELTFRDYVLAEARLRDTDAYRRAEAYWSARLASLPPAPQLPGSADPAALRRPRWSSRASTVGAPAWQALKSRAGAAGLTPTALCLAVFAEVVSTWSASPRFTLNVPRMNRFPLHPEADRVLGEFASFTLLEVDAGPDGDGRVPGFTERAQRIQRQLWKDLTHQQFSGVRMLRELIRAGGGFERALMPVVLTSTLGFSAGDEPLLGARLPRVFAVSQTPQVFLDVQIEEEGGRLVFNWDSVDAAFPPGTVDDMFDAFRSLLGRLAAGGAAWSATDLALVPDDHATRGGIAGPRRPAADVLVQSLFEDRARERPDDPAVITSSEVLTYGDVHRSATQLAHRLRSLGAGSDRPVAVVMDAGWEQVVAAYGALFAGAAYVPVAADQPAARLRLLLGRGPLAAVATQPRHAARMAGLAEGLGAPVVVVDATSLSGWSDEPLTPLQSPHDLAYVLFTSGSTGTPKGAMIEHRGMVNCLRATLDRFGLGPGDRGLAVTALHHDMSTFDMFGVLGAGGAVAVPDAGRSRDAAHWADLVARHGVTVWNSVPAMAEMLLAHLHAAGTAAADALSTLRLAFLGGDWIPLPVARELSACGVEVVSVGGPTETTLWNIWHRVDRVDPAWRSIPYGRPIANTRYHVLDERLQDRPELVTGELYCSGPGVARGYWGDDAATAAAFVAHPETGERLYRTGDLGRCLPGGTVELVGRSDAQVKIRGQRIEPGEIEAALASHPSVRAAVVTAVLHDDRPGCRALAAHVTPDVGHEPVVEDLVAHLRGRLPDHMVPARILVVDEFPLTPNGKVDRRALQVRAGAAAPAGPAVAPPPAEPRTALETVIARTWCDVLGVPDVDLGDDFFALGGDSVLATTIVTRLREDLETPDLPLTALFATLTVAGMADVLVSAEDTPGRLEQVADVHLEVSRMSEEEVEAELARR